MVFEEKQVFSEYIRSAGLKTTAQRDLVLDAFLRTRQHVSVEELYQIVNRRKRRVGYATVYRTIKLIADCGLAREVMFNDGVSRFEHTFGRQHHHHLVCTDCQKVIEFTSRDMDKAEQVILTKYGFKPQLHSYKIFGLCRECRAKSKRRKPAPKHAARAREIDHE